MQSGNTSFPPYITKIEADKFFYPILSLSHLMKHMLHFNGTNKKNIEIWKYFFAQQIGSFLSFRFSTRLQQIS